MAKYEEKFIVINKKHLQLLPLGLEDRFAKILSETAQFIPPNKYYVCNQDEPYAEKVINIILTGEDTKTEDVPENEEE